MEAIRVNVKVTYLYNSGFLLDTGKNLLIFDDFEDPAKSVAQRLAQGGYEHVYFFASHSHFDHYDPSIGAFGKEATQYILSDDIRVRANTKPLPQKKITYIKTYDHWQDDTINVTTFSSTDLGTSFAVELDGKKIFHAGDFNWWDWIGDTHENRKLAENFFKKQLKKLAGWEFDLAFFPVDGRLEASMDKGAREFVRTVKVRNLITMHSPDYPVYVPPADFFPEGQKFPVWSPRESGATKEFEL